MIRPTASRALIGVWFACVVSLIGLVSARGVAAEPTACELLSRWAESYRAATPDLKQLAAFDRSHRIAVMAVLDPETRADLWRQHFDVVRATRADLSAQQLRLLDRGAALLTPAFYRGDAASVAAMKAFWSAGSASFSAPQDRAIWFDVVTAPVALGNGARCDCSTSFGGLDCGGGTCSAGGCTLTANGCGPGGGWNCDGQCQ